MSNEVIKQETQALATLSNEKFLRVYSPEKCITHAVQIKGLSDALERKAPTLSEIKRVRGEAFQRSYVLLWLVYLNEVLDLNKPMSETQMRLCAAEVVTVFNYLKLSELSLIFRKIIGGEYGEFYERFSQAKFLSILREYDQERTALVIDQSERAHAEFRHQETQLTAFEKPKPKDPPVFSAAFQQRWQTNEQGATENGEWITNNG